MKRLSTLFALVITMAFTVSTVMAEVSAHVTQTKSTVNNYLQKGQAIQAYNYFQGRVNANSNMSGDDYLEYYRILVPISSALSSQGLNAIMSMNMSLMNTLSSYVNAANLLSNQLLASAAMGGNQEAMMMLQALNGMNSSSPSYTPSTTNSTPQNTNRTCGWCNGRGEKIINTNPPMYGMDDYKVYCDKCHTSYWFSTGHSHVTCGHCGGTGVAR